MSTSPRACPELRRRVVHCDTLQAQLRRALEPIAARLGCLAIEARALWGEGDATIVERVEVGAAEGDVQRLVRIPNKRRPA